MDAVIASSAGGLRHTFDCRPFDGEGRKGARKASVRLGTVFDLESVDGLPKMGFVERD